MGDNRGIGMDSGWINREFRALRKQIDDLRSERRARSTTINDGDLVISGGAKLIVDGGDFLLLDTDTSTVFRLGPQPFGDRGVSIFREDGMVAFESRKRFANSTDQSVALYGRNGEQLLVEEELGTGLAGPALAMQMQPYLASSGAAVTGPHGFEVTTTSGSFVVTHFTEMFRQNQFMRGRVAIKASDTTTSAEVRVFDVPTGTYLGQYASGVWTGTRATGSTGYTVVELGDTSPLSTGGTFGSVRRLEIHVRRTAGAGTLTVAVPFASGSSGAPF